MNANGFRKIALSLKDAIESAHMGHPDFRAGGRIFATLGRPDQGWGVVMLTPEQQEILCQAEPKIFEPVPGGWGKGGATRVILAAADEDAVRSALAAAWTNVMDKAKGKRAKSTVKTPVAKIRRR
jgi:hypothetical protein